MQFSSPSKLRRRVARSPDPTGLLAKLTSVGLCVELGISSALEVVGDVQPPADLLADLQRRHKDLAVALWQRQVLDDRADARFPSSRSSAQPWLAGQKELSSCFLWDRPSMSASVTP